MNEALCGIPLDRIPRVIGPQPENVSSSQWRYAALLVAAAACKRAGQPLPPSVERQLLAARAEAALPADDASVIVLTARALRVIPPEPSSRPNVERRWTVEVRCPFCGRKHVHGWRAPGGELKPRRLAHCHGQTRSRAWWERYGRMEYDIDAEEAERTAGAGGGS
jgi:hypothetical protein